MQGACGCRWRSVRWPVVMPPDQRSPCTDPHCTPELEAVASSGVAAEHPLKLLDLGALSRRWDRKASQGPF